MTKVALIRIRRAETEHSSGKTCLEVGRGIVVIFLLVLVSLAAAVFYACNGDALPKDNTEEIDASKTCDAQVNFSNDYGLTSDYVYDVLVDNVFDEAGYNEKYSDFLRDIPKCGNHLVLRDGTFQYVNKINEETDYEITYEGIVVRNEVLKYNWGMETGYLRYGSDAVLGKFDLIMRRTSGRYVPEFLKTGNRLEFYANREVIERALAVVNMVPKRYGKDIYDPKVFVQIHDNDRSVRDYLRRDVWIPITGKGLLDLYGVEIKWDKRVGKYELASKLPPPGPGVVGPKDAKILKDLEAKSRLNSYFHEGIETFRADDADPYTFHIEYSRADAVSPLDVYYLWAEEIGFGAPDTGDVETIVVFDIRDKTTGRSLGLIDKDNFHPSMSAIPIIYYKLLERTSSVLLEKYKNSVLEHEPSEENGLDTAPRHYEHLGFYYSANDPGGWKSFLQKKCKASIHWTETDFEVVSMETGSKMVFRRDEELIEEALKELNYYTEKIDFASHFMVENYPMFLLSVLRLYDVNLQRDGASGKVVILPGTTDPEAFFDIVAECTFVEDPSDTEYLKQHLTSWIEPKSKEPAS